MKIAVYAIAKNEADNVDLFLRSASEADHVVVLDTGSTDDTVAKLETGAAVLNRSNRCDVAVFQHRFNPWRFDAARNMALGLVPSDVDVCIICDMDERFPAGWRKTLEDIWVTGTTRMQVQYVFSWTADGDPDVTYFMTRVHARHGYTWTHPVHECLKWVGPGAEQSVDEPRLVLHHYQNRKTSRAQYLTLLEQSTKEDPDDDRNAHYLGREYWYAGRYAEAVRELSRHLALPRAQWRPERAASMSYIAQATEAQGDVATAEAWFLRAAAEYDDRDHWVRLGLHYLRRKFYAGAYAAALRALHHQERPFVYMSDASSWGALPHDVAGTAAFYLGLYRDAVAQYEVALSLAPDDKRIAGDLALARQKAGI